MYDDYLTQAELQRWILEADVSWGRIDPALALAQEDVPVGSVAGITGPIAEEMLAVGREKLRERPLERHGNPNVLTLDRGTSKLSQGPSALSMLVEVEAWSGKHETAAHEPPRLSAATERSRGCAYRGSTPARVLLRCSVTSAYSR